MKHIPILYKLVQCRPFCPSFCMKLKISIETRGEATSSLYSNNFISLDKVYETQIEQPQDGIINEEIKVLVKSALTTYLASLLKD